MKEGFTGCAKTPPSWLTALVHHYEGDKKHVHEFFLSKHFIDGPGTVLICKKCHKRFTLTTSLQAPTKKTINQMNVKRGMCIDNQENYLHHLHTIISTNTDIASQCCYCNFTVNVVIQEPYIGIQIFDELQKTKPILIPPHSKTAKKTNGVKNEPNIIDTLEILSNIIKTLTMPDAPPRKLNLNSKQFILKIGYDSASKAFFDKLEYKLEDCQYLGPPPLTEDYIVKTKHILEEIDMRIMEIYEMTSKSCSISYNKPYKILEDILGTKYDRCHIISPFGPINYLPFNPTFCSLSASCTTLGCVSNMNDKILEWAYKKAVEESPEKFPIYLYEIFKLSIERQSESLQNLIADYLFTSQ